MPQHHRGRPLCGLHTSSSCSKALTKPRVVPDIYAGGADRRRPLGIHFRTCARLPREVFDIWDGWSSQSRKRIFCAWSRCSSTCRMSVSTLYRGWCHSGQLPGFTYHSDSGGYTLATYCSSSSDLIAKCHRYGWRHFDSFSLAVTLVFFADLFAPGTLWVVLEVETWLLAALVAPMHRCAWRRRTWVLEVTPGHRARWRKQLRVPFRRDLFVLSRNSGPVTL